MAWNRQLRNNPASSSKASQCKKWPFAVCAIVVIGTLIVLLFYIHSPSEINEDFNATQNKESLIHSTVSSSTNVRYTANVPTKFVSRPETYIDERGIKRYKGGARVPDPTAKMRKPVSQPGHRVFKNYAENQIYALLKVSAGSPLFGTRHFDGRFLDSFKKSLSEKIEILDTDSDADRIAKQTMIETKAELKQRMEQSEDICAILQDAYSEVQRLAKYRKDIEKMVREVTTSAKDLSEQDLDDLVGAANKMLSEQGLAPIKNTSLFKKSLTYQTRLKKGDNK